jgi:hypothetical protein
VITSKTGLGKVRLLADGQKFAMPVDPSSQEAHDQTNAMQGTHQLKRDGSWIGSSPHMTPPVDEGALQANQDKLQLKTFTRWWDSYLSSRGYPITDDLVDQVSVGVVPVRLLEALEDLEVSSLDKANGRKALVEKPRSVIEKRANNTHFLNLVKEKKIKIVDIGSEDLTEKNTTLILGLTWTLILHYELGLAGSHDELLDWVRGCISHYPYPIAVSSSRAAWTKDFADGRILITLLHAML